MRLEGKVAVITGAQQGIGAAIARRFAEEGADIVVNYFEDEAAGAAVVEDVEACGRRAVLVHGDVALAADAERVVGSASALGGVDILVNNAGIFPRASFLDLEEDEWDRVLDVNLKGSFLCARAAARLMVDEGRAGCIINVSSVVAYAGAPEGVHYVASKAGVLGLTRASALALAADGIRVNCIAPGLADTAQPRYGMTEQEIDAVGSELPLGRIATPDDIAGCALYLASDDAAHVTGQTLHVNGGQFLG